MLNKQELLNRGREIYRIRRLDEIQKIVKDYVAEASVSRPDYYSLIGGLAEKLKSNEYGNCTCKDLVEVIKSIQRNQQDIKIYNRRQ